jgi:hypothetical protein
MEGDVGGHLKVVAEVNMDPWSEPFISPLVLSSGSTFLNVTVLKFALALLLFKFTNLRIPCNMNPQSRL